MQRLPVRVRLLPHQGEPPLRAGMTATVTIDIGRQRSLANLLQGSASAASPEETKAGQLVGFGTSVIAKSSMVNAMNRCLRPRSGIVMEDALHVR